MEERYIEWRTYGENVLHPAGIALTVLMMVALLAVPRKYMTAPMIVAACLLTTEQRVVVAGLDFTALRVLTCIGLFRVAVAGDLWKIRLNRMDWCFLGYLLSGAFFYVARELSLSSLAYRSGVMLDGMGAYFLFRGVVENSNRVKGVCLQMAVACILLGVFMIVELGSGRNVFHVFGGVSEFSIVRDGAVRAQAAFSHPIMAGTFGATSFSLCVGIARCGRGRLFVGSLGAIGAVMLCIAAHSSGPVIALAMGLLSIALWQVRGYLRPLVWSISGLLLILHLVREKPVWHLIGRLSELVGGTGYHRYMLIDAFVQNWREWFVRGVASTAHWGWGLQDVTNQYVLEGVRGGALTLAFFVATLVFAFRAVGAGRRIAAKLPGLGRAARVREEFFVWMLGVCLVTHCVSWISVSYFGQMSMFFYLELAMISALIEPGFWGSRTRAQEGRAHVHEVNARRRAIETFRGSGCLGNLRGQGDRRTVRVFDLEGGQGRMGAARHRCA